MRDDMHGLYPTAMSAYKSGLARGKEESLRLSRLLAASVAKKYTENGQPEMAQAAEKIADIIFDLQARIE